MRAILAIAVLLALASPYPAFGGSLRPRYTTLIVEYTGATIGRPAPAVVITTSQIEGEWYKQYFSEDLAFLIAEVQVVPQSVLNQIT